jgi:hypothetical protein
MLRKTRKHTCCQWATWIVSPAMIKLTVVIAALTLGLGVAACGSTSLAGSESNKYVESQVNALAGGGAKIKSDCPDVDDAKKGKTFTCKLTGPGGKGTATVHITNVNGDKVTLLTTPADINIAGK